MDFGDVLATLGAPQQAEEVGPSQLTQAPFWTQQTQPATGGGKSAGGGTPAGGRTSTGGGKPAGGATPAGGGTLNVVGSLQAAMATLSPD
jgi:hypothetical protein